MIMSSTVLLVEDDAAVREALAQTLDLADFTVISASSFVMAKDHINTEFSGVILSDVRMPGRDGFHLLDYASKQDPELPVVLLTGEGDVPMAVRSIENGAFAFLEKPCDPDQLVGVLTKALHQRAGVISARSEAAKQANGDPAARLIFGTSDHADALRASVRRAASIKSEALVTGPQGSGVSKVAEVIHLCSPRAQSPFEKRAAAGMDRAHLADVLLRAAGGTLFLDEIGQLPVDTQLALVEALDNDAIDVRIIAGNTRTLGEEIHPDLFYRISVTTTRIPALAERPEDIPVMFRLYVSQAAEQSGVSPPEVSPELVAQLMSHRWPGNARALMQAAMRLVLGGENTDAAAGGQGDVLSSGTAPYGSIHTGIMPVGETQGVATQDKLGLADRMARVEKSMLIEALQHCGGHASDTARLLKLARKTFYDKLARHNLKPEDFRS
jgi:two-component system C4-dicarboxylate transport response regulator DctD